VSSKTGIIIFLSLTLVNRILFILKQNFTTGVPVTTIWDHVHGTHPGVVGRPKALSESDELFLLKYLQDEFDRDEKVTRLDFRKFVREYVNGLKLVNSRFKENMPGLDWLANFEKRHKCRNLFKVELPMVPNRSKLYS